MRLHIGYVFLVVLTGCGESFEQRLDREVGWHEIKPHVYDAKVGGIEIGTVTVPGRTQRVTFFMWGIPKDSLADDEEPYVIGEMDRDLHMVLSSDEDLKYSDLGKLAAAAYYHGGSRVILTRRKAYLVTSDEEQDAIYEAQRGY
jgi:hypothetical protein